MKTFSHILFLAATATSIVVCPATAAANDTEDPVWSDEFNLPVGAPPDATKWSHELGKDKWGNHELETYTDALENAHVVLDPDATDGHALAICGLKTPDGYTSARINTRGKFEPKFGRIEARLKLPRGQGAWPAFWLLGVVDDGVRWPECGEIDVMEVVGNRPGRLVGSLHGPGYSGSHPLNGSYTLPDGAGFDQAYHVFAVDWSPDSIVWSVDGHVYHERTPASVPEGTRWVFNDHPFYIILNLAVGGDWPGSPDETTVFPLTYFIDYVRVYAPGIESPAQSDQ